MARDVVARLMARGQECARDVGPGGFAGFMAGVQHGLEIARREPTLIAPLSRDLREELLAGATRAEVDAAAQETAAAITAMLWDGRVS
jgi:hypothetical protein